MADALEESATRARARSGFGAAAAALQRSASLTTDPATRQAREAAWLSAEPGAEAQVGRQAADLAAAQAGDPFAAAFLDGFARWLGPDPGGAVPRLRQAQDLADRSADPRHMFWAGIAALTLSDDEQARSFFGRETAQARSEGSVAMVAQALTMLSVSEFLQGHGASARATATEGLELAQATRQRNIACYHLAVLARVAASFGTEDETRSLVTQCYQATVNHRLPRIEHMTAVALGEMELARGNAERALAYLSEVAAAGLGPGDPLIRLHALPCYAEAGIRAGQPDLAACAAASFGQWAAATQSAPDLGLHARLLALLAPPEAADPTSTRHSASISPRSVHSTGRGPSCSTENHCAADANDSTHVSTCASRWTCSSGSARTPGPGGPAPSCEQPARPHAPASQASPSN